MIRNIVLDCADPEKLAAFWAAATGFERQGSFGNYVVLADPAGARPRFLLQQVPETRQGKNRLHLDLGAPDTELEAARLVRLGAERVGEYEEYGARWVVLRDPEGNEFCIVAEPAAP